MIVQYCSVVERWAVYSEQNRLIYWWGKGTSKRREKETEPTFIVEVYQLCFTLLSLFFYVGQGPFKRQPKLLGWVFSVEGTVCSQRDPLAITPFKMLLSLTVTTVEIITQQK